MEKPPILNRADWLFVLFFNLGYPTLRPFRFPLQELKKFLKATSKVVGPNLGFFRTFYRGLGYRSRLPGRIQTTAAQLCCC